MQFKPGQKFRFKPEVVDEYPHLRDIYTVIKTPPRDWKSTKDMVWFINWEISTDPVWTHDYQIVLLEPDYLKILKETVL